MNIKAILFLIIAFSYSTIGITQDAFQILNSSIKSVTIHLQGAEIKREVSTNLPAGTSEIIFTDLSPKIKPQSIRVSANQGVTMLSITNRVNFLSPVAESEEVKQLKADVADNQAVLQALEDQKEGYLSEIKLLENNQKLTNDSRNLTMTEILTAADLYRNRVTMIKKELSKIKRDKEAIDKTISTLNQQLYITNNSSESTSEIYVTVKSETPQNAVFKLEYVVGDAGWAPAYDLFSGELTAPIQLKYRALAYNNSGIDWNNLPITLSTVDPMKSANQPTLQPWRLRENAQANIAKGQGRLNYLKQIPNNYQRNKNYSGIYDLNPNFKDEVQADLPNAVEYETIEVADINTEFIIQEKYTIPTDAKPYSIDITSHELAANYQHYAVPKMDKDAFLIAQITGWEKLQLITGQMNIYRNDNYIGAAKLDTRNFTDTLDLSLGRDAKVLVKRVKREELTATQFLGGNKKWTAVYDITIKNNHNVPIDIEVLDQVPISTNKDITVDIQEVSNAERNEKTGQLRWDFQLATATSKQLTVGFSVKYPKGQDIRLQQTRTMQSPRFY